MYVIILFPFLNPFVFVWWLSACHYSCSMPLLRSSAIHSHCALILIELSLQRRDMFLKTNYRIGGFIYWMCIFGPDVDVFWGMGWGRRREFRNWEHRGGSWDVDLLNLHITQENNFNIWRKDFCSLLRNNMLLIIFRIFSRYRLLCKVFLSSFLFYWTFKWFSIKKNQ